MKRHLTDEERSTLFSRLVAIIAAVGLLYVSASVAVMVHLVNENNQTCESRQQERDAGRQYLIMVDPEFTERDLVLLDEIFPKLTC